MTEIEVKLKVKDCPFCGSSVRVLTREEETSCTRVEQSFEVACTDDECYLAEGVDTGYDSPAEAILAWNAAIYETKRPA